MRAYYIVLFILMGLATYSTRACFLVFSQKVGMPEILSRSLKYIPVSILTALIVPGILMPNGSFDIAWTNPYIFAGLITAACALIFKHSIISILLGIVSLVVFRMFM